MTVWANAQHVWIQFKGRNAKRFDTSPRGSGPRGPQLRFTDRPPGRSEGFVPRHWKGT